MPWKFLFKDADITQPVANCETRVNMILCMPYSHGIPSAFVLTIIHKFYCQGETYYVWILDTL